MDDRVLIVDDEPDMVSTIAAALRVPGISVATAAGPEAALELARTEGGFDLLVTDIRMPKSSGMELFREMKKIDAEIPAIFITAYPQVESAVAALREGARDYLIKPFHPDELRSKVLRVFDEKRLRGENALLDRFVGGGRGGEIAGESPALKSALRLADKVAPAGVEVLLLGESGTGKELLARRIHEASGRPGRFVAVDCGAIPRGLLENELFGHVRGAYTGADSTAPGLIEIADRGTFFLDEVGELPSELQVKLLRVLQEKRLRRVGGLREISVDFRIVAATKRDLPREVEAGRFRDDLYFRLSAATVLLPPLRERRGDVRILARKFLPAFAEEFGKAVDGISDEAMAALEGYDWPGNIRELENVLKRAIICAEEKLVRRMDLPETLLEVPAPGREDFFAARKRLISEFEKGFLAELLAGSSGKVRAAAERGGVPLSNFYHYMKKYGIDPETYKSGKK